MRSEGEISLQECDPVIASDYTGIVDLTGCAEIAGSWKLNCLEAAVFISDEASDASAGVLIEACDLAFIVDGLGEGDSGSGQRSFERSELPVSMEEADCAATRARTLGTREPS